MFSFKMKVTWPQLSRVQLWIFIHMLWDLSVFTWTLTWLKILCPAVCLLAAFLWFPWFLLWAVLNSFYLHLNSLLCPLKLSLLFSIALSSCCLLCHNQIYYSGTALCSSSGHLGGTHIAHEAIPSCRVSYMSCGNGGLVAGAECFIFQFWNAFFV